jgi:succinoglycan biosynthesis protein ExoO
MGEMQQEGVGAKVDLAAGNTFAAIIPLCNKEPYVARAIASVLAQTRSVDEIIIVDDASTDRSLEQVKRFQDPRLRVVRRTDPLKRGPSAARNLGIQSSTSKWIGFLDADDTWHDDFIEEVEKLVAHASEQTGLLFTGWENVWPDGRVIRDPYSARSDGRGFRRLDLDDFISVWLDAGGCPISSSAVVLRRDKLYEAGLFSEHCHRGEDKDMWLRVMQQSDALSSPRVCSSYYRGIPGQINDTISTNMRHWLCATLEEMIPRAPGPRRRLLMRLFNQEVYQYARGVGLRERLSPEIYRGFYISIQPQRYLILLALSYCPTSIQLLLRRPFLWARRAISRHSKAWG